MGTTHDSVREDDSRSSEGSIGDTMLSIQGKSCEVKVPYQFFIVRFWIWVYIILVLLLLPLIIWRDIQTPGDEPAHFPIPVLLSSLIIGFCALCGPPLLGLMLWKIEAD